MKEVKQGITLIAPPGLYLTHNMFCFGIRNASKKLHSFVFNIMEDFREFSIFQNSGDTLQY